ncbi:hypothetical protein C5167_023908 [Papaver somniferum]|uniref:Ninja-family protein n=1 Tax=Papaver somniferum TaxID=3469 RepID=A0A4Y7JQE1_PAPSO|nr:AFP homolog 2-like [Papaver somniferum]RZC62171.1 hypothetical protein C5167_023908 [Papaver somniferum]
MEIIEGNDEEIELSLGLSIGGGRSFKKFEKPNQEKSSLTFDMKFLENDSNGLDLEKRKREIHKMRRQEARKKREIKKNGGREKLMNRAEQDEDDDQVEQTSSFKKLKPENEEEKGLYPVMLPSSMQYGYHHQPLLNPFSNGFGAFPAAYQMMPFWVPPPPPPPTSTSSSSPETAVVVDDKNVVQPIVCKPFIRAFQFSDTPIDKVSDDGVKTRDSDSCGSAVISDHQISSQIDNDTSTPPPLNLPQLHESNNVQQVQSENITATSHPPQILTIGIKQDTPNSNKIIASSNITQSNLSCSKSGEEPTPIPSSVPIIINTSKTEFPPQNLPPLQQSKCANGDSHKPPIPRVPHQSKGSNEDCNMKPPLPLSPKKVVVTDHVETNQLKKVTTTNEEETNKSPKAATQVPQIKSLPKMPCVSTVGDGPGGKTITGFLYRYTNAEVSIVCVCHGSSFSPAEFVKHAGRTDVSQPLKHITVLPSPFG